MPDLPLPPETETADSLYEDFFGGKQPQPPWTADDHHEEQVKKAATQLRPANLQGDNFIKYPDVDEDGNAVTPELAEQQAKNIPAEPEPETLEEQEAAKVRVKLPDSGFERELGEDEISKMYVENLRLQEKARAFEDLERLAESDPRKAQQISDILNGQPVEATTAEPAPTSPSLFRDDDDDPLGDADERLRGELARQQREMQELRAQLEAQNARQQELTDRNYMSQVEERLRTALDTHPYTKGADEMTRRGVAELALLNVRKYAHEGLTHEDAVKQWGDHFLKNRTEGVKQEMQAVSSKPRVPVVPESGQTVMSPPRPAPRTTHDGGFGKGLRDFLDASREKLRKQQEQ